MEFSVFNNKALHFLNAQSAFKKRNALNILELITKINKKNLITRGCCENYNNNNNAYIIFEYNCFIELLKNNDILKFVNKFCSKSEIYYAQNHLRHIKYNDIEYDEKLKNETEIWISITFQTILIKDFINIIDKLICL